MKLIRNTKANKQEVNKLISSTFIANLIFFHNSDGMARRRKNSRNFGVGVNENTGLLFITQY